MASYMLDYDPVRKRKRIWHEDGEGWTVESRTDVTDVIEANKAAMSATDERTRWGELSRVASIPLDIYFRMKREGKIDPDGNVTDEREFLKWLDDPENILFRTRPGKVSR